MQSLLSRDSVKVALVVNAGSRRGQDALASSEEMLRSAGIEDVRSYAVHSGEELETTLDEVAADKPDLLVIGGGSCGKDGQSKPVGFGNPTLKVDKITVGGKKA